MGYKPIKRSILGFLDDRIKKIKWEIDSASLAKQNAQKDLEELRKDLSLIEKHHEEMTRLSRISIEKKFEERCIKFQKSLEYTQNAAKEHIELMQKNAAKKIEKEFLDRVLNLVSSYFDKKNSAELDLAVVSTNSNLRERK